MNTPSYRRQNNWHVDCGPLNKEETPWDILLEIRHTIWHLCQFRTKQQQQQQKCFKLLALCGPTLKYCVNKSNGNTTFCSEFSAFLKPFSSQWTVTEECWASIRMNWGWDYSIPKNLTSSSTMYMSLMTPVYRVLDIVCHLQSSSREIKLSAPISVDLIGVHMLQARVRERERELLTNF